ncbi:hypothetical protein F7734_56225 [Scytonema sp. UIC 10036]|uniref:hypothetical protein n=1 Tax=Scytonema sp. UIC 10036 TaxID=2304196 RepID=UPI0012DAED23|nr:hypothetical protein [Scytonema sp. UIC 10036]MUH01125.1 hypothetical protein [Scytonema sp. UIC 10036]
MKRVYIKTETIDKPDGSTSTKTEREEITENSGLLEAYGFLLLIIFTLLVTGITYQIVSSIINRSNSNGIQIQEQPFK